VARWEQRNPDYNIIFLDRADADRVMQDYPVSLSEMPTNVYANALRTVLLYKFGGFWGDCTLYPAQPLDSFIDRELFCDTLFAFEKPAKNKPLANWFLGSVAQEPSIAAWNEMYARLVDGKRIPVARASRPVKILAHLIMNTRPELFYSGAWLKTQNSFPYFSHHYAFTTMLGLNPAFDARWKAQSKPSARAAHVLHTDLKSGGLDQPLEQLTVTLKRSPLHKLSHKGPYDLLAAIEALDAALDAG
jgi:hypothetical protein